MDQVDDGQLVLGASMNVDAIPEKTVRGALLRQYARWVAKVDRAEEHHDEAAMDYASGGIAALEALISDLGLDDRQMQNQLGSL
ncbi:hypothetical protein RJB83_11300 [Staphylococcus epidermidis]|uniref:hypothetical protein n=1 Tax=Staphylococcus TaxID=1279 RepID=UPI0025CADE7F|nr:hypothetical protein [Staphylococcus epidermidis]MDN3040801.1 hypothetical protein [Enterococcus faecium]MDS3932029.1 hypothetical protein [Staphylococcus epidermidis]MDS3974902.1 hypothetical protein [Staphylococcus epidermidis]